ncbi:DUF4298 domain-containing protein [Ornithobacterium rhinotracheale]|uniref:DUF4298 domain-containing protein n=1 Tax=Ornithobacterium rhinotracheale TaxID=28251 RepID=UPI00129C3502|nr:DUF4298 domain-containing protein [Ornithobacterium rhinotracheale]MRI64085.1 DUF4298 domain-containing protein [Ornithobacterium rhinotracheale]MRJ09503.1 DUF4298 domain-containing protein [Ornithobacterium rhinotracheale]
MTLEEAENLMKICEQDLKMLQDFNKALSQIEKNTELLEDYYSNQYMNDINNPIYKNVYSMVLSEDGIWDLLTEIHQEKLSILKKIVKKLH